MTDRTAHARIVKLGADILNQRRWGDSIFAEDAKRQDDALAALGYEAGQIAKLLATPAPAQPEGAKWPSTPAEFQERERMRRELWDMEHGDPWAGMARYGAAAPTEGAAWVDLLDEDRERAFNSQPDMLEGFLKKWGWLHFAKAIEAECRAKNAAAPKEKP